MSFPSAYIEAVYLVQNNLEHTNPELVNQFITDPVFLDDCDPVTGDGRIVWDHVNECYTSERELEIQFANEMTDGEVMIDSVPF